MSNIVKFHISTCLYNAAVMLSGGTVLQVFLSAVGVSELWVGFYASAVSVITIVVQLLFSKTADEIKNMKKAVVTTLLLIAICALGLLPSCLVSSETLALKLTWWVLIPCGLLQTVFIACYAVLGYKLPYSIINISDYGALVSVSGLISGAVNAVLSLLLSWCVGRYAYHTVMCTAFGASGLLVLLAALVCKSYRIGACRTEQLQQGNVLSAFVSLLKQRDFYILIFPNFLRGISMGVIQMMAVICLGLGHSDAAASSLVTVTYLANFLASAALCVMAVRISERWIGMLGAVLLLPMVLAFGIGKTGFLVLAFLALAGKCLVDNAIPMRVYKIISPEIACTYNTGRMLITTAGAAVASAVSGFLIGNGLTTVFILLGVGSQLIASVFYLLYKRTQA